MDGIDWPALDRSSHVPLYEQLKRVLERAIVSGALGPGDVVPPEGKLCSQFGVSTITVRRALFDLVTDGKLVRHVGRGTFVAEERKPLNIQLLVIGFEDAAWRRRSYLFGELIAGVGEVLWSSDSTFSVLRIASHDLPKQLTELVSERRFDGIILRPEGEMPLWAVELLEHHQFSYVFVKRRSRERTVNCVADDDVAYGYVMAQQLISLGHRDIAYISGWSELESLADRFSGFRAALQDAGIEVRDEWIALPRTGHSEDGYKAAYELLNQSERPTAIVVGSDGTSIGVYKAADELGLEIPSALAVVGADEGGRGETFAPPLTSCAVLDHRLGEEAATVLLEQLRTGDVTPRERLLEPQLVIRQSCGSIKT